MKVNPPARRRGQASFNCCVSERNHRLHCYRPRSLGTPRKRGGIRRSSFRYGWFGNSPQRDLDKACGDGRFACQRAIEALSTKPCQIAGIDGGSLKVGARADLVVFDQTQAGKWIGRVCFQREKHTLCRLVTPGQGCRNCCGRKSCL